MKVFLLAAGLLCGAGRSSAQTPSPPAYEFLTVIENESSVGKLAKLVFAPAFQGRTEMKLEELPNPVSEKHLATYQQNQQRVNQQLGELTAAGWELVHVSYGELRNQFLFRKTKR